MPRFNPEPPHRHDSGARTGVLLVNLGTPDAPTAPALRRYLKQFLSDPRVVEIPRPIWWLILNGIILNTRPAKSARKYAQVWMDEGSPLRVHTERQAKLLKGLLGEQGDDGLLIDWAMRYGQPSVADGLDRLKQAGAERILILPLYPQYAASTTASVMDAVGDWLQHCRNQPAMRSVRNFHDDPSYIAALAHSVRRHWAREGLPAAGDQLVISFHGLPKRSLDLGDPYFCECQKTARLLAEALDLPGDRYRVTFQSRFGAAEWLQPYTQATLEALARAGTGRVDVICPGFVADCLETLEEIALECRAAFLAAGGKAFHYIPCVNEDAEFIATLAAIVRQQVAGWPTRALPDRGSAERAKALGATS